MIFNKNRHYCSPFPWPKFYFIKDGTVLDKVIRLEFTNSAEYHIGEDQSDVNKLMGFSYGLHHQNSDRIGWRYIPELNNIEIVLYSYVDGVRQPTSHIANLEINQRYYIRLDIVVDKGDKSICRNINIYIGSENRTIKESFIKTSSKSCLGYTLGGYFGGNRKSPHEIIINEF